MTTNGGIDTTTLQSLVCSHWKQIVDVMEANEEEADDDPLNVHHHRQDRSNDLNLITTHFNQMLTFYQLIKRSHAHPTSPSTPSSSSSSSSASQDLSQGLKFFVDNECVERVLERITKEEHEQPKFGTDANNAFLLETMDLLVDLPELVVSKNVLGMLLLQNCLKEDGEGDLARTGFLKLVKNFSEEQWTEEANVLISSLSAAFAQLPTFYAANKIQLRIFLKQIVFVDQFVEISPPSTKSVVTNSFVQNFLKAVLHPQLTQDCCWEGDGIVLVSSGGGGGSSNNSSNKLSCTTMPMEISILQNYTQLLLSHLKNQQLLSVFVDFVLSDLYEVLLQRLTSKNTDILISTVTLLNKLISTSPKFVDDTMMKYLTPRHFLIRSEVLSNLNYEDSITRFLSLIPSNMVELLTPKALIQEFHQYLDEEMLRNDKIIAKPDVENYLKTECSAIEINGSYGPLLDVIFKLLGNFMSLSNSVVLVLTELISTIARSRRKELICLFLDGSIVFQPMFTSFFAMLNRIKVDIERGFVRKSRFVGVLEKNFGIPERNNENLLKNIYWSHWMLELASIAQQHCWDNFSVDSTNLSVK